MARSFPFHQPAKNSPSTATRDRLYNVAALFASLRGVQYNGTPHIFINLQNAAHLVHLQSNQNNLGRVASSSAGGDMLELDADLWGGGIIITDVLDTYASVLDGNIVLDFGNGGIIALANLSNLNRLEGHIVIV